MPNRGFTLYLYHTRSGERALAVGPPHARQQPHSEELHHWVGERGRPSRPEVCHYSTRPRTLEHVCLGGWGRGSLPLPLPLGLQWFVSAEPTRTTGTPLPLPPSAPPPQCSSSLPNPLEPVPLPLFIMCSALPVPVHSRCNRQLT